MRGRRFVVHRIHAAGDTQAVKAVRKRRRELYCSFCGKAEHEVYTLVSGPIVMICDECVAAAQEIVTERRLDAGVLAVISPQVAKRR